MGVRKLYMRQSYRIIPIYTADVSGVCSALYELGGMTVMHDPSGCNSTYNTHDEIRWYDQDSLIFISGLSEIDAIMGNDEKLIHDTAKAARELKPKFIALASSPIPYMNGTDFPALAEILEAETGIPAFAVPTNGMHDYVYGAGLALAEIAERFTGPSDGSKEFRKNPAGVNILGMTPLDFGPLSHGESVRNCLEDMGWEVIATWAMGDDLETLAGAGEAAVNLVVSSVGLRAAKVLKRKFGTPYVVGAPVGEFAGKLSEAMEWARETGECTVAYLNDSTSIRQPGSSLKREPGDETVTLIGEPVTMGSLAAAIKSRYGCPVRVLCPLEEHEGLLAQGDAAVSGEEEIEEELRTAEVVVADPLYRPVCPKDCRFYELPHIAFSGRIFLRKIKQMPGFAKLQKTDMKEHQDESE